jgi:dihydroorotase
MIETGLADWPQLIHWFTAGAARVVRRPKRLTQPGAEVDLTLIAPNEQWTVNSQELFSKSKNTPFDNWELRCRVKGTIRGRQIQLEALS